MRGRRRLGRITLCRRSPHYLSILYTILTHIASWTTRYGEEYTSEAPTVDMVRGRTLDREPAAVFTFKYRPYGKCPHIHSFSIELSRVNPEILVDKTTSCLDVLLANGVIPRPVPGPQPSTSSQIADVDEKTAAQIRRLEVRRRISRRRAGSEFQFSHDFQYQTRLNALKTKAKVVPSAGISKTISPSRKHKSRSRSIRIPPDADIIDLTTL